KLPFQNKSSIDIQNLKAGVYILKIDDYSLKFIKK
ncbi:MAG: T9SS type A sorting domain-containing protein, partial [Kaistella sp.]